MNRFIPRAALSMALLTLAGCDWVGIFAKEAAVAATSHRGWDSFTFKGQLPAEFGIDAIAFYSPNEPGKASCQAESFEPRKTITRRHAQRYTAEIQAQPQDFSFEIPLSYYKGLCGMRLGRVKLEIRGRHGPLDWQKTYASGGFYIVQNESEKTASFDDGDTFASTGVCSWWFQQSQARSRFGEIEKILNCRASMGSFLSGDLTDRSINLVIKIDPIETPSHEQTWIKFHNGWKPCLPKEGGWIKCQSPALFKTFKMNGQTCTVYPGCTE